LSFAADFTPHHLIRQMSEPTIYDRLGTGSGGAVASPGLFGPDSGSSTQLIKHYRLWNYVAISRICYKISESFPHISHVTEDREEGYLSREQRQHLRSHGGVLQIHEDLEPVNGRHPLSELVHKVNPQDWWGSFIFETVMFWQLTGEFYWWLVPNAAGLPSEMWVLPSQWVQPKWGNDGELEGYQVEPDGDARRRSLLPPDQIIVGRHKSPINKDQAHSPTAAGAEWIDNSESIEKARWQTFQNGPLPSVAVELDPEYYAKPDPEVLRAVKDRFVARYGGTARAGEPMITPPGMKVTPFSMKPAEMDFPATIDQVRDQVLALHGVPKVIAGVTTDVNRAAIFGANLIFCESTINPLLTMLAGIMTEKLAPRFGSDLRIWFDDCRPDDAESEREETRLDWLMGAITPNERRADRGRDSLESATADEGYIPLGVQPIGSTDDEPLTLPPEDDEDVRGEDEEADVEWDEEGEPAEEEVEWAHRLSNYQPSPNGKDRNNGEDQRQPNEYDDRQRGDTVAVAAPRGDDAQGVARAARQGERRASEGGGGSRAKENGQAEGARSGRGILTPASVWQAKRTEVLRRSWHRSLLRQEKTFHKGAAAYFAEFGKRADRRLSKMSGPEEMLIPDSLFADEDQELWRQHVGPAYVQSMVAGTLFEMAQLGVELPEEEELIAASVAGVTQAEERTEAAQEFLDRYPGTPDIFVEMPPEMQEEIVQYLKGREIESWQEITDTWRKRIEARLVEGGSPREIVRDIRAMIQGGEAYHNQAGTIARTEATGSMNNGAQNLRKAHDIPKKIWLSTMDAFVRDGTQGGGWDHITPNFAPPISNAKPFIVSGEQLMYPGDRAGSAGNVINCRCFAAGAIG